MAVTIYINRDATGQLWPPVHEHEAAAAIGLLQRLFEVVSHEPAPYAVFVNLQAPQADIVVVTELGLGVIEMKHYAGRLALHDDRWYAGTIMIRAGSRF